MTKLDIAGAHRPISLSLSISSAGSLVLRPTGRDGAILTGMIPEGPFRHDRCPDNLRAAIEIRSSRELFLRLPGDPMCFDEHMARRGIEGASTLSESFSNLPVMRIWSHPAVVLGLHAVTTPGLVGEIILRKKTDPWGRAFWILIGVFRDPSLIAELLNAETVAAIDLELDGRITIGEALADVPRGLAISQVLERPLCSIFGSVIGVQSTLPNETCQALDCARELFHRRTRDNGLSVFDAAELDRLLSGPAGDIFHVRRQADRSLSDPHSWTTDPLYASFSRIAWERGILAPSDTTFDQAGYDLQESQSRALVREIMQAA